MSLTLTLKYSGIKYHCKGWSKIAFTLATSKKNIFNMHLKNKTQVMPLLMQQFVQQLGLMPQGFN